MSAYGAIPKPSSLSSPLAPTAWKVKSKSTDGALSKFVIMYHLTLSSASTPARDGLVSFMADEFADEVERGDTYPQEPLAGERLSREAFEGYYFAADVMIGFRASVEDLQRWDVNASEVLEEAGTKVDLDLDVVADNRKWKDCVAGFYYIKPNYPGRSSHICNAGFVVPFASRGHGFAHILARSYLHYAPQLGYLASVFNLVYVNNEASIRLWETLNFTKAGRIPRAGRLRRKDGQGEEYVDAWVYYKSFETDLETEPKPDGEVNG
ncbi:hypothetical protein DFH11DRAFT_99575 [Phellopilus nigrolimitatus]|nr:hypothetical protein DFH11DRAFT_99575 [Phellopilus nigrolimitatus]